MLHDQTFKVHVYRENIDIECLIFSFAQNTVCTIALQLNKIKNLEDSRYDDFTALKFQVVFLWVVTQCNECGSSTWFFQKLESYITTVRKNPVDRDLYPNL
jgi:hypothetical protein